MMTTGTTEALMILAQSDWGIYTLLPAIILSDEEQHKE